MVILEDSKAGLLDGPLSGLPYVCFGAFVEAAGREMRVGALEVIRDDDEWKTGAGVGIGVYAGLSFILFSEGLEGIMMETGAAGVE